MFCQSQKKSRTRRKAEKCDMWVRSVTCHPWQSEDTSIHIRTECCSNLRVVVQRLQRQTPQKPVCRPQSEYWGSIAGAPYLFSTTQMLVTTMWHNVTKFPFMGGSAGDKRDRLAQDADSLLQLHFSRYWETLIVGKILGHVLCTSQKSKYLNKCVVRKLWVVHCVIHACTWGHIDGVPRTYLSAKSHWRSPIHTRFLVATKPSIGDQVSSISCSRNAYQPSAAS